MMSYNPMGIGRIAFKSQTTYGTAETSGFTAIECDAVLPGVAREMFTKEGVVRQGHHYFAPIDGSQHGGELSITMPLHGYSSAGHESTPTTHAEAYFLESILGSLHKGTRVADCVSDAGSSTSVIDVDSAATMTHFAAGQARAVKNASGAYNASFVTAVSGTDLTILNPLASNNEADSPVLSSINCFLSTTVAPKFFTFEWQGLQSNSRLLLEGCVATGCEITLDAKSLPIIAFTFVTNSVTASAGSALTDSTYAKPTLPACLASSGSRMMRGSNEIAVSGLTISIEQTLSQALSHNASQGVGALLCTSRTAKMTFTELLDSSTAPTTATSGTSTDPLLLQIGNTAGVMLAVSMCKPALLDTGDLADTEGIIGQVRNYGATNYTGDTATGGVTEPDPANSDFRIAFL